MESIEKERREALDKINHSITLYNLTYTLTREEKQERINKQIMEYETQYRSCYKGHLQSLL